MKTARHWQRLIEIVSHFLAFIVWRLNPVCGNVTPCFSCLIFYHLRKIEK